MAKNKNQNRQHDDQQQSDERSNQAAEPQEQSDKSTMGEEHIMPASTHVARKQQKRFGHN